LNVLHTSNKVLRLALFPVLWANVVAFPVTHEHPGLALAATLIADGVVAT
jgi:hypothetical protein